MGHPPIHSLIHMYYHNMHMDGDRYKEMLGVLLKEAAENSRDLYQFDPFHKVSAVPCSVQSINRLQKSALFPTP